VIRGKVHLLYSRTGISRNHEGNKYNWVHDYTLCGMYGRSQLVTTVTENKKEVTCKRCLTAIDRDERELRGKSKT
jgi:hypothetical protein